MRVLVASLMVIGAVYIMTNAVDLSFWKAFWILGLTFVAGRVSVGDE